MEEISLQPLYSIFWKAFWRMHDTAIITQQTQWKKQRTKHMCNNRLKLTCNPRWRGWNRNWYCWRMCHNCSRRCRGFACCVTHRWQIAVKRHLNFVFTILDVGVVWWTTKQTEILMDHHKVFCKMVQTCCYSIQQIMVIFIYLSVFDLQITPAYVPFHTSMQ